MALALVKSATVLAENTTLCAFPLDCNLSKYMHCVVLFD